MFKANGTAGTHFWIKEGKLTTLLTWAGPKRNSVMSLQGKTLSRPNTASQWFTQLVLANHGREVLNVEIVQNKVQVHVNRIDISKMKSYTSAPKGDVQVIKEHEKINVTAGDLGLVIYPSDATKFTSQNEQHRFRHFNIDFRSALPGSSTGIFAELSGVKPISDATSALLKDPMATTTFLFQHETCICPSDPPCPADEDLPPPPPPPEDMPPPPPPPEDMPPPPPPPSPPCGADKDMPPSPPPPSPPCGADEDMPSDDSTPPPPPPGTPSDDWVPPYPADDEMPADDYTPPPSDDGSPAPPPPGSPADDWVPPYPADDDIPSDDDAPKRTDDAPKPKGDVPKRTGDAPKRTGDAPERTSCPGQTMLTFDKATVEKNTLIPRENNTDQMLVLRNAAVDGDTGESLKMRIQPMDVYHLHKHGIAKYPLENGFLKIGLEAPIEKIDGSAQWDPVLEKMVRTTTMEFCFLDEDDEPAQVSSFELTVLNLDKLGAMSRVCTTAYDAVEYYIQDRHNMRVIEPEQYAKFNKPNKIRQPGCQCITADQSIQMCSTLGETQIVNPTQPMNLTAEQSAVAGSFLYRQKSCFYFQLKIAGYGNGRTYWFTGRSSVSPPQCKPGSSR